MIRNTESIWCTINRIQREPEVCAAFFLDFKLHPWSYVKYIIVLLLSINIIIYVSIIAYY